MRDILFRGKRIDNGEWVEGSLIIYGLYPKIFTIPDREQYEVSADTVGQYTGLTDKNGKKIFEGDIVETPHYYNWKEVGTEICKIVFENGAFGVRQGYDFILLLELRLATKKEYISGVGDVATEWIHPFVVIGNIHDNPELLEGK